MNRTFDITADVIERRQGNRRDRQQYDRRQMDRRDKQQQDRRKGGGSNNTL